MSDHIIEMEVKASASGFEQTQAIVKALATNSEKVAEQTGKAFHQMAEQTKQAFADATQAIVQALTKQAETEEEKARRTAAEIKRIRGELTDETNRLTQTGVQYRINQIEAERNAVVAKLRIMIQDEQEFCRLRDQAFLNSSLKIRQIAGEEAAALEAKQKQVRQAGLSAAGQVGGIVGGAAGIAGMGLIADLAKSGQVAMDFDKNMRNVDSIAHMTEAQFKATSQAILDMTKEVPKSASDLAAGLYDITSSGFSGQQALDVLKVAAQGAAAGLSTTSESAKALAGLMNAYNLKTGPDSVRFMNSLFQTIADGVTTMPELASHIGMVATNAANSGVPIEKLGAAIADLTYNGISTASSIQSFNMLLDQMKYPTEAATKAAAGLTDANGKLALSWFKSGEAGKHIAEVGIDKALQEISKATQGNIDVLHSLIPEQEALRAAMILTKNNGSEYSEFIKHQMEDANALSEALKRQGASYAVMSQYAENAADRVRIAFGGTLLKALGPVFQTVIAISNAFLKLPESVQSSVAYLEIIAAVCAVAVAALAALGFAAMGLMALPPALTAIATAFPSLATAATALGGALSGVFGYIAALIVDLAAPLAFLYALWTVNFLGIQDITNNFLSWFTDSNNTTRESLIDGWSDSWKAFANLTKTVLTYVMNIFASAFAVIEFIVGGSVKAIAELFAIFYEWYANGTAAAMRAAEANWGRAFLNIFGFLKRTLNSMRQLIGDALTDIVQLFQGLGDAMINPLHPGAGIDKMKQALGGLAHEVGETARGITLDFTDMNNKVSHALVDVGAKIAARAEQMKGQMGKAFSLPGMDTSGVQLQAPTLGAGKPGLDLKYGAYSDKMFKEEEAAIKKSVQAGKISHEEAIKQLEDLKTKHKLTALEMLQVDKDINLQKKAMAAEARKGKAGGKKAAREAEAAARKAAAEAKRQETEQEKQGLEALLAKYKQITTENFNFKIAINEQEIEELKKFQETALQVEKDAAQKKIDELLATNAKIRQEKLKAQRTLEADAKNAVIAAQGETYVDKLGVINNKYDSKIQDAKNKGLDGSSFDLARNAEIAKLRADSERKAQDMLDKVTEDGYAKKRAAIVREYDEEIRLATGEGKSLETLRAAKLKALAKLESDEQEKADDELDSQIGDSYERKRAKLINHYAKLAAATEAGQDRIKYLVSGSLALKRLDEEEAKNRQEKIANILEYGSKIGDILADSNRSGFQKFTDIANQAISSIKDLLLQKVIPFLVDAIGPAFQAMFTAISTGGLTAFGTLIAGWAATASAAVTAAATMAGAWLVAMGPVGWVIGGILAVSAAIAGVVIATQKVDEAFKNISPEVALKVKKDRDSGNDNRVQKTLSDYSNSVVDLTNSTNKDDNLNPAEKKALINSGTVALAKKMWDDINQINRDAFKQQNQDQIDAAEAAGDTQRAADLKAFADKMDIQNKLKDLVKSGLIKQTEADQEYANQTVLIDRQAAEQTQQIQQTAFEAQQAREKSLLELTNNRAQSQLDAALASGKITRSQYDTQSGVITNSGVNLEIQQYEAQAKAYAKYANDERLTDTERESNRLKSLNAIASAEKALSTGMKNELDSYKTSVNDFYSQKQEQYDQQKQAIEDQISTQTLAYNLELEQTNRLIAAKNQEIEAINQKQQLLNDQAQLAKDQYTADNVNKFNSAIADTKFGPDTGIYGRDELGGMNLATDKRVTIGADDLTFAGLDDQKKKVEDLFALKQLTQTQEAEQLIEIASKKGALAKKEMEDKTIVQTQQIAALDFLKQAFTEFNDAQAKLIDGSNEVQTQQNNLAKDSAQITLDTLTKQKTQTANAVTAIQNSYAGMLDTLNANYVTNKTNWDASMKSIADGMDPQISAIISKYAPLEAELQKLAAMQAGVGVSSNSAAAFAQSSMYRPGETFNVASGTWSKFADGGTVTGGRKGHDSVAAMLMPGEEVLNPNSGLGERLNRFLSGRMSYGSGGSNTNNNYSITVEINNPTIRETQDIDRLAESMAPAMNRALSRLR